MRSGRTPRSIAQLTRAIELDPLSLAMHANLGIVYWRARRYDEAAAAFQRASSYSPRFGDPPGLRGHALGRAAGSRRRGWRETNFAGYRPRRTVSGYIRALYHLGLEEHDQALTELEGANQDRSWLVAMVKVDPMLDSIRLEPRFQALVQRLRFRSDRVRVMRPLATAYGAVGTATAPRISAAGQSTSSGV